MENKIKALCIVAHPDDDLIWMGGTILSHKDWEWTVFSLCRATDIDRAPKFRKACEHYGAHAIISDLDDEKLHPLKTDEVVDKIKENLPESERDYDYIFTHGANGEYGHPRHKETHRAVYELIKNKDLKCSKLYFFSYVAGQEVAPHDSNLRIPIANKNADWFVKLNKKIYQDKINVITKLYGFQNGIFETLASKNEEAFEEVK
jgi:LmbE family N-acetylglucosaminyl deacetylase